MLFYRVDDEDDLMEIDFAVNEEGDEWTEQEK